MRTHSANASVVVGAVVFAVMLAGRTVELRGDSPSCRVAAAPVALGELPEASGVAVSRRSPGVLWAINDSGQPVLFALDSSGTVKGKVRVAGASVDDWEDIAVGPCPGGSCLYVADIGDNHARRSHVTIYGSPSRHRRMPRPPSRKCFAPRIRTVLRMRRRSS